MIAWIRDFSLLSLKIQNIRNARSKESCIYLPCKKERAKLTTLHLSKRIIDKERKWSLYKYVLFSPLNIYGDFCTIIVYDIQIYHCKIIVYNIQIYQSTTFNLSRDTNMSVVLHAPCYLFPLFPITTFLASKWTFNKRTRSTRLRVHLIFNWTKQERHICDVMVWQINQIP